MKKNWFSKKSAILFHKNLKYFWSVFITNSLTMRNWVFPLFLQKMDFRNPKMTSICHSSSIWLVKMHFCTTLRSHRHGKIKSCIFWNIALISWLHPKLTSIWTVKLHFRVRRDMMTSFSLQKIVFFWKCLFFWRQSFFIVFRNRAVSAKY